MSKVALCLLGYVGSPLGPMALKLKESRKRLEKANLLRKSEMRVLNIGYTHYKKHILDKNNVDVFIHSWDVDFQDAINELYQPKASVYEQQIKFNTPAHLKKRSRWNSNVNDFYSRWYTLKRSVEIKAQYEEENQMKYDWVMVGRFDVAWETDVIFDNFNPNYFYAPRCCKMFNKDGKCMFMGGKGPIYSMSKGDIKKLKHKHTL